MNSLSEARSGSRLGPGGRVAVLLALLASAVATGLAVALLSTQIGAEPSSGILVLTAIFSAVALLGAAALGWHAGVRLTRRQLGEALRQARQQAQVQAQLQTDWQWATDADHHLVRWQAPLGALSSSWVGAAATQALWERFEAGAQAGGVDLRARLESRVNFTDAQVRSSDANGGEWVLRGIACLDAAGRFTGYQGTARRQGDQPSLAAPQESSRDFSDEHAAFSYTISHDLRAPLRAVEGFARILKEDYGRQLDRLGNDHLDRVMGAAGRMQGMIDALLSLAQLSSLPLARQAVDLSRLAHEVLEELRRVAPERSLDLHVQPGLLVEGDPTLLRLVLENLLGNAWKYSGKCPLAQIRFEAQPSRQAEGQRVFCISDNGAGFDMRFADRLFGAFQRLHSASDFPGTGVGLASVRRIVRRHGGAIWAESEVGQGARFYFTLAG